LDFALCSRWQKLALSLAIVLATAHHQQVLALESGGSWSIKSTSYSTMRASGFARALLYLNFLLPALQRAQQRFS
jgi:hypothetical protein